MKRIGIIPARGGSKRVHRKNMELVAGQPLFSYSVEIALEAGVFDELYVNTDDEEIAESAQEYGAIPYRRPNLLGGDRIFIIDVLKEMLAGIEADDDSVIGIMLPTSPLRLPDDITGAYDLYIRNNHESPVVSVTTYETPVQLAQRLSSNGRLVPLFEKNYLRSTRSTDHETVYKYNESIIFNSVRILMTQTTLIGDEPMPYEMPPERSIMIDHPYQLQLVEYLLGARRG